MTDLESPLEEERTLAEPSMEFEERDLEMHMDLPPALKKKLMLMADQLSHLQKMLVDSNRDAEKRFAKFVTKSDCAAALKEKADAAAVDEVNERLTQELERARQDLEQTFTQRLSSYVSAYVDPLVKSSIAASEARLSAAVSESAATLRGEFTSTLDHVQGVLSDQVQNAVSRLGVMEQTMKDEISGLHEDVTDIRGALELQSSSFNKLSQRVQEIDRVLETQSLEMKRMSAETANLTQTTRARLAELSASTTALQRAQADLKADQAAQRDLLTKFEHQASEMQNQLKQATEAATKLATSAAARVVVDQSVQCEVVTGAKGYSDPSGGSGDMLEEVMREGANMRVLLQQLLMDSQSHLEKMLQRRLDQVSIEQQRQHGAMRTQITDSVSRLDLDLARVKEMVGQMQQRLDGVPNRDDLLEEMNQHLSNELQSHIANDFNLIGLMLPVREDTLAHLRKLDNWVDLHHAIWTRIGRGEDYVGVANERPTGGNTWTGSFVPLNGVYSDKKCLSCSQPLDPYLVLTPKDAPRLKSAPSAQFEESSRSGNVSPRLRSVGSMPSSRVYHAPRRMSQITELPSIPSQSRMSSGPASGRRSSLTAPPSMSQIVVPKPPSDKEYHPPPPSRAPTATGFLRNS